jgi:hypothetical protein
MKWFALTHWVLSILLMAVSPVYGRDVEPSVAFNSTKGAVASEEGLVWVNIPIELLKREARKAMTAEGTQIVELARLDFDPIDRLVVMEGVAELPADIVTDMNDIAGGGEFLARHRFNISFKLPTARKLALTRYFSVEFVEFRLNGQDYLPLLHRLGQFAVGMMINTSLMDYMLDIKPEVAAEGETISQTIKNMIERKGLRFSGNSISFKLDLSQIAALKPYTELADLRLWQVVPVLMKGTKDQFALRIEAGLGVPANSWFAATESRHSGDAQSLSEARADLYSRFSDTRSVMNEVKSHVLAMRKQYGIVDVTKRENDEIARLESNIESRAREVLSKGSELFVADPEKTHELFVRDAREHVVAVLADIKRRFLVDQNIAKGGRTGSERPFLEKRLSQETMSQAVRFFRDFEFDYEQMLPEVEVIFDPKLPGVHLRGIMNMNLNTMMAMGLEGSGVVFEGKPWRAAEESWGAGLPFDLSLRIKMFDEGMLGLDIANFSIMRGLERTHLDVRGEHGAVVGNWVKMALVNTMATTLIDDPVATTTPEGDVVDPYITIRKNLDTLLQAYAKRESSASGIEGLIDIAQLDVESNPFLLAGKEQVAGKAEYFFKDLITYDESDHMIKFKLDPKIASDSILASENTVQLWNLGTVYDSRANRTYLELAIGDRLRSQGFLNSLLNRPEEKDSQNFVGIDETRAQSPSDMQVDIDLKSFEKLVNNILMDAYVKQNKEVETLLSREVESENYLIKDVSLSAVSDQRLELTMTLTHLKKEKRSALNPARWFGETWPVTRKTITLAAVLGLSVEKLDKYKGQIKLSSGEVSVGDEVVRLDLENVRFTAQGDTGVLDKILGLVAGNLDFKKSTLAKKMKILALKFAQGYLHSVDAKKNGNLELGGIKLNRYAKFLVHSEELLLQLNPHIMANAFDIRLLNNQDFAGEKLGLVINKKDNRLKMDFSTAGALAAVDKGEILKVMVKARDAFAPYLSVKDATEFMTLLRGRKLYDMAFYNSDYTKLSLFHRFRKVLAQYPALLDVVKPDMTVITAINNQLGTNFGIENRALNPRHVSVTGVEVAYILAGASVFREQLSALIAKSRALGLDTTAEMAEFIRLDKEMIERYIRPLMALYAERFEVNNSRMVSKAPTDWDYSHYPEARFAHSVYNRVKKQLASEVRN